MKRNRFLLPIGLIVFLLLSLVPSQAQSCVQNPQGVNPPWELGLICQFTANSAPFGGFRTNGIIYWQISWVVNGTVSSASLSLDSSVTGLSGSWTTGGILSAATIGSLATTGHYGPNSAATTASNFGQLTPSITGSGTVTVTLLGYSENLSSLALPLTVPTGLGSSPWVTGAPDQTFNLQPGSGQEAQFSGEFYLGNSTLSAALTAIPSPRELVIDNSVTIGATVTIAPTAPLHIRCLPNTSLTYGGNFSININTGSVVGTDVNGYKLEIEHCNFVGQGIGTGITNVPLCIGCSGNDGSGVYLHDNTFAGFGSGSGSGVILVNKCSHCTIRHNSSFVQGPGTPITISNSPPTVAGPTSTSENGKPGILSQVTYATTNTQGYALNNSLRIVGFTGQDSVLNEDDCVIVALVANTSFTCENELVSPNGTYVAQSTATAYPIGNGSSDLFVNLNQQGWVDHDIVIEGNTLGEMSAHTSGAAYPPPQIRGLRLISNIAHAAMNGKVAYPYEEGDFSTGAATQAAGTASMSGATATFPTSSGNWGSTFTVGETFTAASCSVGGYNTQWVIVTGGSGTASLTATSYGVTALGNATGCSLSTATVQNADNFFDLQSIGNVAYLDGPGLCGSSGCTSGGTLPNGGFSFSTVGSFLEVGDKWYSHCHTYQIYGFEHVAALRGVVNGVEADACGGGGGLDLNRGSNLHVTGVEVYDPCVSVTDCTNGPKAGISVSAGTAQINNGSNNSLIGNAIHARVDLCPASVMTTQGVCTQAGAVGNGTDVVFTTQRRHPFHVGDTVYVNGNSTFNFASGCTVLASPAPTTSVPYQFACASATSGTDGGGYAGDYAPSTGGIGAIQVYASGAGTFAQQNKIAQNKIDAYTGTATGVAMVNSDASGGVNNANSFLDNDVDGFSVVLQNAGGTNTTYRPGQITGTNVSQSLSVSASGTIAKAELSGTCTFSSSTSCAVTFPNGFTFASASPQIYLDPQNPGTVTFTITARSATGFTITASASNSLSVNWDAKEAPVISTSGTPF